MKQINKIITISVLSSSILLGATIPNIGDIQKQVEPPKDLIKPKETPLIELGGVKKYAAPMKDDKSGRTIFVKSFKIDGALHVNVDKLQKLISSYTNKDLTFNQIQEVTSVITKEYRNQGYFVARAYLPVQNINKNNGVIIIAIIEGSYGKFKLENNSKVKNSTVQGMLDNAKQRDNVISTNTLERAMLIINDTPGVVVTAADVKPGKEVGTSDFAITTQEGSLYNGYVVADNTGSKYTGKNRLMAGVDFNSPFNIGDKISLSGLVSNGADLKNGRVAYSLPLASNGLKGEISYSQTNYSLVKDYEALDALGTSKTLDATITYPIKRTRLENLNLSLNIANKDLKDEVRSTSVITEKDTQSLNLGLDYDKNYLAFGKNTQSQINLNLTYGRLNFDNASDKISDEAGADTNGNYSKVNIELSNTIALTNKLTFDSSLKMQYALGNKNLDGSEDFSIGGSNGVKLYPNGELSAENGYLLNLEAKYRLPNLSKLSNTVGIFYDRGKAFMSDNKVDFEAKSLQDVGIGYYASYDSFFGKLQVAWNTNSDDITSEENRNSRILFQGGLSF
ncbi:ShlB/FhaC/HecB family hemolysin secretion/activation protein [Poseidonibacter lekithochrous]|uniref:ShlB/FhaC/HecB family hemolysin secretion/activation protein n=1 Tax=Poseidonibacter TaxID=2321187 RepID=UPI001C09F078|nr:MULTISPECIES: ShlB/FhaC/HecB family hemolysin secretion/activation protein [Poseidonibacter]MBU3013486.1 ShlB/FhaC/HecB family hemolysin secretion/activation protein [Poseidonibacter lekithochrous]MDO6826783.1 ShlB/FhaC/HecB family hemolysin secretion/activation protein [Poseidonibacter sp. 1_MG-2023]